MRLSVDYCHRQRYPMHSIRPQLTAILVLTVFLLASCDAVTGAIRNDLANKPATKALTAFSLSSPPVGVNLNNLARVAVGAIPASVSGTINESAKTVSVTFPTGTDVSGLIASFTTTGASVRIGTVVQSSGTTMNSFANPVVYRVTAEDGTTADYTVTVTVGTVMTPPSSAKALTAFTLAVTAGKGAINASARQILPDVPAFTGSINESAKTVLAWVPTGTIITALTATFTTTGFSVMVGSTQQTSGTTSNSFAAPVVYRVTAADGSTVDYTVTVIVQEVSSSDVTAPTLPTPSTVSGTATTSSVTLSWAQATDANALSYQVRYRATPTLNAAVSSSRAVVLVASGWTTATDWASASSYPDTVSGTPNPMYTVTGLALGKSYDFAVSVRDTALNQSEYTVLTASTVGDLVAPTLSTLEATISTTPLGVTTLAWYDASDAVTAAENLQYSVNVGLKSGSAYVWGENSGWTLASLLTRDVVNRFVSTILYNGANLVGESTYGVSFSVKDAAGNSKDSTTIDYTAPAADVTAPMPNAAVPQMSVVGTSYYLNWIKGTDNVTVQGNLQYRVDRKLSTDSVWTAGTWTVATNLSTGSLSSQYQSLLVSPLTTGTWQFIVYVRDEATNVGSPYTTFNYLNN